MSSKHLDILRDLLSTQQWLINQEIPGNHYDIAAYWRLSHSEFSAELCLVFESLGTGSDNDIEQSYGCHMDGQQGKGLYFSNNETTFMTDAACFVESIGRSDHATQASFANA